MPQTPQIEDVILAAMDARLASVYTAFPGRIVSYNASRQVADIQPTVQEGYLDEAGDRQSASLPTLLDVPVMFPRAGGFRITFPVASGDTCLLVIANCSIDRWLANGGTSVDPADDRRHNPSDAVAILGLFDATSPLQSAPTSSMSMGKDGGPTIEVTGSEIQAGGTSQLATKADIDALKSWAAAHVHNISGISAGTASTVSLIPTVLPPSATGTSVLKGG